MSKRLFVIVFLLCTEKSVCKHTKRLAAESTRRHYWTHQQNLLQLFSFIYSWYKFGKPNYRRIEMIQFYHMWPTFGHAANFKAFRHVEILFVQGRNLVPRKPGIGWWNVNKPCKTLAGLLGTRTNKVSTCLKALLACGLWVAVHSSCMKFKLFIIYSFYNINLRHVL